MIFYVLLPFLSILLIVLQTTLADLLFSGWLTLELSLIAVIYAGFRLDLIKGMLLAFAMGTVFDCVSGAILGLYTLLYLLIFLLVFFVSFRMASEKLYLIALLSLICSVLESLALVLFYRIVLDFEVIGTELMGFMLQSLLITVLSVGLFYVMSKMEGFLYGKTMQPPQRAGAVGI